MSQVLSLIQGTPLFHNPPSSVNRCRDYLESLAISRFRSRLSLGNAGPLESLDFHHSSVRALCGVDFIENISDSRGEVNILNGVKRSILHIQTLRNFPRKELNGKVVMVRFDSTLLQREAQYLKNHLTHTAFFTIEYLCYAGAKVVLVGNWSKSNDSVLLSAQSVADYLSTVIHLKIVAANDIPGDFQSKMEKLENANVLVLENLDKFKDELANCSRFAKRLSAGVDIFVNDAFSESHKILSSNVGIARFCYASVAGFHFEYELSLAMEALEITKRPYIAIVGGGNLLEKSIALRYLVSSCDGLVFIGTMAFQFMHALGLHVSLSYVDVGAVGVSLELIKLAQHRNIPILLPKDLRCMNNCLPNLLDVFPAHGILNGWTPIDLGPLSLHEISSLLSKCKKVLWIGPVKFNSSQKEACGTSDLAFLLHKIGESGCDVTVAGNAACKAVRKLKEAPSIRTFDNASVLWELLKKRPLPGVAALDKAYPFELDWATIFASPTQPLVVDIGSGNGLFLLRMARRWKNSNFLGLEINKKLVTRCLDSVRQSDLKNVYFLTTNATSTFHSIVSSYPGALTLVSILCPNPDFNKTEHRWRMLQRRLVEAITDLLPTNGKIFLQSDIEDVAIRMKEQFLVYGKGKLAICEGRAGLEFDHKGWLKENPFGIRSDWEQHVVDAGAPMYRIMILKK